MNHRDKFYIELAEIVHSKVIDWDPLALISGGAPEDEYDTIEKRFLSGLINHDSEINLVQKVKNSLEYYGAVFTEIESESETKIESEILKIFTELKKYSAKNH